MIGRVSVLTSLVLTLAVGPRLAGELHRLRLCGTRSSQRGSRARRLRRRRFRPTDLRNSNLRGANLTGVDFSGADLRGADLTKPISLASIFAERNSTARVSVNQLTGANLRGALTDSTMPTFGVCCSDASAATRAARICRGATFRASRCRQRSARGERAGRALRERRPAGRRFRRGRSSLANLVTRGSARRTAIVTAG